MCDTHFAYYEEGMACFPIQIERAHILHINMHHSHFIHKGKQTVQNHPLVQMRTASSFIIKDPTPRLLKMWQVTHNNLFLTTAYHFSAVLLLSNINKSIPSIMLLSSHHNKVSQMNFLASQCI